MTSDLRSRLEQSAAETGTSFNGEILRRIEQSFMLDGSGGPVASTIFKMAQAAFVSAGRQSAANAGVADWLSDATCYKLGMLAAIEVLAAAAPQPGANAAPVSDDEQRLYKEWSDFLLAREARVRADQRSLASGGGAPGGSMRLYPGARR